MLPDWCQDAVTVLRAPIVTRNGRSVRDWAQAVQHELRGCSLQPSTTETEFNGTQRNASASQARLLCPQGADVRDGDRIVDGSRTWEVDGVPYAIKSPTGRVSHTVATLREWRG